MRLLSILLISLLGVWLVSTARTFAAEADQSASAPLSPSLSSLSTLSIGPYSPSTQSTQSTQFEGNPTAVSVMDDRGETITLPQPARRIIALYGAYNEMLFAIGAGDRIVARTLADSEPSEIAKLPAIGTHMRPNTELVAGMRPDLILQMGGRKQALEAVTALETLGLTVAHFNVHSFEELFTVLHKLGTLTGREEASNELVSSMRNRLVAIENALQSGAQASPSDTGKKPAQIKTIQRPSVFFEVRYPNLLGAGTDSIVNDIINHAGGRNCIQTAKKLVRLNEEALLLHQPDVYLVQRGPMNPDPVPVVQRAHFAPLTAVAEGRVYILDEQKYSRPGPRAVDAVEELARLLHPNIFRKGDK